MAWWDDEPWSDDAAGEDPYYFHAAPLLGSGAGWDEPRYVERETDEGDAS